MEKKKTSHRISCTEKRCCCVSRESNAGPIKLVPKGNQCMATMDFTTKPLTRTWLLVMGMLEIASCVGITKPSPKPRVT